MSDVFYARGTVEFYRGTFATEYLAYVLSDAGITSSVEFQQGSAKVYDLGADSLHAFGTTGLGQGRGLFTWDPLGAFEDFSVYPEGAVDPVNGFVLASNGGAVTAGVGAPWTRHYYVVVPPKAARYAVPHVKYAAIPAGASQYLDAHQLEILKVGLTAPTNFGSARSLQVTVRPTRLNYATGSTHVPFLVPGNIYTASADVGGTRKSMTFTATASTADLDFGGTASRILVEAGTTVGDYFDGSFGPDYLWEQGGTPGATRSYYYPDRVMRHYILVRTLQENVAMGMSVEAPIYAVLPAPSTTS